MSNRQFKIFIGVYLFLVYMIFAVNFASLTSSNDFFCRVFKACVAEEKNNLSSGSNSSLYFTPRRSSMPSEMEFLLSEDSLLNR